ncbi:MAG: hypothetical protein HFE73_06900 [Firmicutes bacterium]|nr:hypothetical protein [Bacillota bacterium]
MLGKDKLYELLDIEDGADFQYFENVAALFECEEEIEESALLQLLLQVDKETLTELIHNYFEETTDFLPGDAAETYGILERIKFALMGLARNSQGDGEEAQRSLANLAEELNRFRRWYAVESKVYCSGISSALEEKTVPMRDAITMARLEQLGEEKYFYDFSECLDYPLEEYIMSLGDMVAAEYRDEDTDGYNGETSAELEPDYEESEYGSILQ